MKICIFERVPRVDLFLVLLAPPVRLGDCAPLVLGHYYGCVGEYYDGNQPRQARLPRHGFIRVKNTRHKFLNLLTYLCAVIIGNN